jgi:hypothetical protein
MNNILWSKYACAILSIGDHNDTVKFEFAHSYYKQPLVVKAFRPSYPVPTLPNLWSQNYGLVF